MKKYETIDGDNCWTETICVTCKGSGFIILGSDHMSKKCPVCGGHGEYSFYSPQIKVKTKEDGHYVCIIECFSKGNIPKDIAEKSSFIYDIKGKRILKQRKPSEKNALLNNMKQITVEGKL